MKTTSMVVASVLVFTVVSALLIVWSTSKQGHLQGKTKHVVQIDDGNFQKVVVEASKTRPILVDFYSDWCLPCRFLEPILEEVAKEVGDRAVIGKINSEQNLITQRFRVSRVPVIFIIKDSEIKHKIDGLATKEMILKALKEFGV